MKVGLDLLMRIVRKILYKHDNSMRWEEAKIDLPGIVINLGCGANKFPNILGIDLLFRAYPDVVANLEKGIPFLSNSVDCVLANHVLEHIDGLDLIMSEIHRVLKPYGKVKIFVPHYSNPLGLSDYTHRRLFGVYSFYYFVPFSQQKLWRRVPNYKSKDLFQITSERIRFYSPFRFVLPLVIFLELLVNSHQFIRLLYEYHFSYWFPAYGIQVEMCPIKMDEK
jgi:SAM-dependent methyltransferase